MAKRTKPDNPTMTVRGEWSSEDKQRLAELWERNIPIADIARELRRSEEAVRHQARLLDVSLRTSLRGNLSRVTTYEDHER